MSFLVAGGAALTTLGGGSMLAGGLTALAGASAIGGMISGAFGAQTEDELIEQRKYAAEMYGEQRGLLREQKGLAGETAELGYDVAQSQFAGGRRDVSMGTQAGMRGIQEFGATAASRSGLATSGTIEGKVATQTGDLMAKYKSDMTKLFESKDLAAKEKGLSIGSATAKADLAFRSGEMSAEDAYQSTLTGLESQPTTFLEGMFS